MTVSIIGSGRVGLCLGVLIAKAGHSVLLTDIDPSKKEILEGKFSFYEPQLESYFHSSKNHPQMDKASRFDFYHLNISFFV